MCHPARNAASPMSAADRTTVALVCPTRILEVMRRPYSANPGPATASLPSAFLSAGKGRANGLSRRCQGRRSCRRRYSRAHLGDPAAGGHQSRSAGAAEELRPALHPEHDHREQRESRGQHPFARASANAGTSIPTVARLREPPKPAWPAANAARSEGERLSGERVRTQAAELRPSSRCPTASEPEPTRTVTRIRHVPAIVLARLGLRA